MIGFPTRLLRKVQLVTEGPDRLPVYTLTFAIPDMSSHSSTIATQTTTTPMRIPFKPYHELRLDLGDVVKMVIPNYKPKSYSVSALRSTEFDVTYKLYPNGRASGYLHQLVVMGSVEASLQQQQEKEEEEEEEEHPMMIRTFVKQHSSRRHNDGGTHIGIIVYGVGITEGLPVVRAELERNSNSSAHDQHSTSTSSNGVLVGGGDKIHHGSNALIPTGPPVQQVVLVWCVRTMADTFWHSEIQALLQTYPERFHIVYIVSRELGPSSSVSTSNDATDDVDRYGTTTSKNIRVLYGQRISAPLIQEIFESFTPHKDTVRFLSVGTKEMMAMTDDLLRSIEYPMPQHSLLPKVEPPPPGK